MSRCNEYKDQVIELDFLYPSEGIHRRWDEGGALALAAALTQSFACDGYMPSYILQICLLPLCAVLSPRMQWQSGKE